MPSSRVSELRSPVQDPCPRLSEDTQMLQFQDTDGHVIALKRERSCVNLYVNTILEQVDVRYFIIDEQKRSYTISKLEGDFKLHEDLKRLRALQDALFNYEDKELPVVSRKSSGNIAGGDNQEGTLRVGDAPLVFSRHANAWVPGRVANIVEGKFLRVEYQVGDGRCGKTVHLESGHLLVEHDPGVPRMTGSGEVYPTSLEIIDHPGRNPDGPK